MPNEGSRLGSASSISYKTWAVHIASWKLDNKDRNVMAAGELVFTSDEKYVKQGWALYF